MKKSKRILSLFLTILLLFSALPMGIFDITVSALSLEQLKLKFPQGKYWNHVGSSSNNENGYTNTPCSSHSSTSTCNAYTYNGTKIGWQCFGFALKLGYDVYGTNPKTWEKAYNLNNIKPGDIINYDGNNPGHTVFVIAVNGNTVSFAECNYGGRCIIRWDRSLQKSEFNNLYNVYVAPYALPNLEESCNCSTSYAGNYTCTTSSVSLTIRNGHGTSSAAVGSIPSGATVYVSKANGVWAHVTYNGTTGYASMEYLKPSHSHSYTSYYESAHPHKVYKKCSCGDWAYTGATKVLSTCSSCWAATSVSFNKSSIYLVIPSTQTATLNIQLSAAETWPSGAGYTFDYNSNVVSMSQNGTVLTITAKNAGSTNFTMKIVDKNNNNALIKSAVCPITVKNATYNISYNANGGTGAPSSQIKTYDVPLTLSKTTPKRTGYTFMGWATSSSATSASYLPENRFISDSNTTLYAVWKRADQLPCNGSFSSPVYYGNQEYYFKYTPSQSGKYVIYSEASKDTKVYLYNSSGTLITSNDDGGEGNNFRLAYNLTAGSTYYYGIKFYNSTQTGVIPFKFGEIYTVNYNVNSGTGAPSKQEVDYGKRVTLSMVQPNRQGYKFLGWSRSSTATSVTYYSGSAFNLTANTTLYAVWEADCTNNNHDYGYWKYSDGSYHIRSCKNCSSTEKASHTWGNAQYVEHLKQYKYFCSGCASEKYVLITESIAVETLPTKTIYEKGEVFDATGLKVNAKFAGGSSAIVSGYSLSGFDSSTIGTKTITVSYNGKTTTFNVTVVCNTHKYTNSCDTKCNVCSATRTITHTYSNNCDKSCNVCGITRTVGAHEYTNNADTTCNSCGAKAYPGGNTLVYENGKFYHVVNRQKVTDTTLVNYNGKWCYVNNGIFNTSNTLVSYNGKWLHVNGGQWVKDTTLVNYNGKWIYVKNGVMDNSNTLVNYNGKFLHVKGGQWVKDTTLVNYNGKWIYVKNGVMDTSNTLVKYNGKWLHVKGGQWVQDNTRVYYNGVWFNVRNGVMV